MHPYPHQTRAMSTPSEAAPSEAAPSEAAPPQVFDPLQTFDCMQTAIVFPQNLVVLDFGVGCSLYAVPADQADTCLHAAKMFFAIGRLRYVVGIRSVRDFGRNFEEEPRLLHRSRCDRNSWIKALDGRSIYSYQDMCRTLQTNIPYEVNSMVNEVQDWSREICRTLSGNTLSLK